MYQWQSGYSVGFGFEISCDTGTTLEAGQAVSVGTNIGELFSWEGSMSGLRVEQDGVLLCTVDITADTVTFKFAEGAEGAMEIEGRLFTTALTADDVGAEDGSDVTKTLQIGEKEAEIVFKFKSPDPPSSSSIGTVDVDTSWKTAWSCDSYTGAEVQIEVNPIGSLDLYGSTTVEGRKPHTHGQLFIKDEIPEHGFIDQARIQIYASVPTLAESTIDYVDKWHGNYSIPQGAYYAQRAGTLRYSLTDAGRMTRIEQNDGETIKEFEARIKEKTCNGAFTTTRRPTPRPSCATSATWATRMTTTASRMTPSAAEARNTPQSTRISLAIRAPPAATSYICCRE